MAGRPIADDDRHVVRARRRRLRLAAWATCVICVVAGVVLGWTTAPGLGAALLVVGAGVAFVPFALHRRRI